MWDKIKIVFILISFSFLLFYSCREKIARTSIKKDESLAFIKIKPELSLIEFDGYDKNGYLFGSQNMVLASDIEFTVEWSIYRSSSENMIISLPSDWGIESNSNSVLLSFPDSLRKDYFIVKKFSKEIYDVKLLNIVQKYLDVIKSDTLEVASNIDLKKYTQGGEVIGYYFTSDMVKDKLRSRASTLLVERDNFFYEFTMKVYEIGDAGALLNLEFETILDNIFINGDKIFGNKTKNFKLEEIEFGG